MKVGKPKSKRVPVRLRNKIQKSSAAKQRKNRKEAKKNPEWRSRLKKDPGIPNLFPYKDKILAEIEESKRRKEEDARKRKDQAKERRAGAADAVMSGTVAEEEGEGDALLDYEDEEEEGVEQDDASNPMAALLASARARASHFDHADDDDNNSENEAMDADTNASADSWDGIDTPTSPDTFRAAPSSITKDISRRAHDKAFKQVLSSSDVILYVLDARDPQSTRSPTVESAITSDPSKRLILILNKIDLIPAPILKSWLLHLRKSFPTLPLRASSSAPNAKIFDHKHLTPANTANTLIKALKAYSASAGLHRAVTVGIIGYPNVGKSSVINALTSRLSGRGTSSRTGKECPVGAEAGVTTALREVKLDGKIKLIDSPGIVFPSFSSSPSSFADNNNSASRSSAVDEQAKLILLNALPPRSINDPIPAVSLLLRRLSASEDLFARLQAVYDLPALMCLDFKNPNVKGTPYDAATGAPVRDLTTDFLIQVARKRGRLGKGGVPNLHAAAQTVVADWRDGRIQGWVEAPVGGSAKVAGKGGVGDNSSGKVREGKVEEKIIVTEWAKEFKIEGLWGDGVDEVEGQANGDVAMGVA